MNKKFLIKEPGHLHAFLSFFFLVVLGFELRALSRRSNTWTTLKHMLPPRRHSLLQETIPGIVGCLASPLACRHWVSVVDSPTPPNPHNVSRHCPVSLRGQNNPTWEPLLDISFYSYILVYFNPFFIAVQLGWNLVCITISLDWCNCGGNSFCISLCM
jgi:hypothetical protein